MSPAERSNPRTPFAEITLSDVFMRSHAEIAQALIETLRAEGLYSPDYIYCGVEGAPVQSAGSFGDRTTTYAVDEELLIEGAQTYDKYGSLESMSSPLMYALSNTTGLAAIAVFKRDLFTQDQQNRVLHEWQLLPGYTMDDAAVAIVYFDETSPHEEDEFDS